MNKYFIFTVDTEGDNLWGWKEGREIKTTNSKELPKFQNLCNKYGVKPVYLVNYEMARDKECVDFLKNTEEKAQCEIGMHIHAWNSPPDFSLPNLYGGNAYITEYPIDVMKSKATFLKSMLEDVFDTDIISHRSGRWATNMEYLRILREIGIKIDCSYTPGVNLSSIPGCSVPGGNDYKKSPVTVFQPVEGLYEIPMTTRRIRFIRHGTFKHKIKALIRGKSVWCRPLDKSVKTLVDLERKISKENKCNYIEMMIHSSELMPGANPYFKTKEDIELLYKTLEDFFVYVIKNGYIPVTFKEFIGVL